MKFKKELLIRVLSNYILNDNLKKNLRQNYLKNYSLNSGERQTAKNINEIRKDHIVRYQLVLDYIQKNRNSNKQVHILDMFCGNGYGSYLVASGLSNCKFLSIDGSTEAIKLAKKYYHCKGTKFKQKFFPFKLLKNKYDYAISLESVEHIKDDMLFLQTIYSSLKDDGILFLSTPNENKQSLKINENHFHYRHYVTNEMIDSLKQIGFELIKIYGQDVYIIDENGKITGYMDSSQMDLIENYDGQFCVYILKKSN